MYDPQQPRSWLDHGVACLSEAAWVLWLLGYPDQALRRSDEMLTLAQELSHPFSFAYALFFASGLHQLRRETQAAHERAEAAITLSTEQGFPTWLANGMVLQGWALAEQGERGESIAQIREGLAAHQAMGEELLRPYFLALLAEAYGKAEQIEDGLTVLAEALVVLDKNGEHFYEAELYRLQGTLTLKQAEVRGPQSGVPNTQHPTPRTHAEAEAEAYFVKAIDLARQQQAKSWELRAVMSLSRLWQQQGKRGEARRMLAEIYSWFTEGFATADLQEARALLAELS
ncbi:MAG: hypothetical protein HY268_20790 [Deltaproteobacteria bacterium]|nr:hypothetical protein [Deltaproteobacteria bacterium]